MISVRAMEFSIGETVEFTMVSGAMASSTAKVCSSNLMARRELAFGKTGRISIG